MTRLLLKMMMLTLPLMLFGCMKVSDEQKETAKPAVSPMQKAVPDKQVYPLDINTAREEQLKAVVGDSDIIAKKIIAGRPYANTEELVSKGVLSKEMYYVIKDRITVLKGTAISK